MATSNWALFVVGIAIGIAMGAWRPGTGGGESAAMHPADPADASGTDASGGGADGGGADGGGGGD